MLRPFGANPFIKICSTSLPPPLYLPCPPLYDLVIRQFFFTFPQETTKENPGSNHRDETRSR